MNLKNERVKILIPAAGFGTRVGSPPAKELFLRADTSKPMIEWTLEQAMQNNIYATVITRKDKLPLIDYLTSHPDYLKNFNLFLFDHSKDWQDSLLKAKSEWAELNLVLLPDTTWEPTFILKDLVQNFVQNKNLNSVAALHQVHDTQNWGILCKEKRNDKNKENNAYNDKATVNPILNSNSDPKSDILEMNQIYWCEKPTEIPADFELLGAWGIFGFAFHHGESLLNQLMQSQLSKQFFKVGTLLDNPSHLDFFDLEQELKTFSADEKSQKTNKVIIRNLTFFKDLTRLLK